MPQRFVPKYDIKIRGGEHIIEWRYGAHPTVHAVSPSGVPLVLRPRSQVTPNASDGVRQLTTDPGGGGNGRGGTRNKLSVLPPIHDSGRNKNSNFSLSELDDISLKNEVLRKVKEVPDRNLQGLLANLRTQDRDRDGILSTDIVKGTLKKFQLHLSEDGLKNLCKKFGQAGDLVYMVRYEEMFSYLTKSRMEALRAPPPQQQRPAGNPVPEQQPQQQQQQQHQSRKINMRNRVMFSHQDESKLIEDLGRQISGKPVNMADLRRTMYGLDRDRNDFLSGQQVEIALSKCGFHLTPDVRARLLLATDRTGAGIYKIETLMNYITRVKPETHNTVYLGNNHHPRQPREGQLPMNHSQQDLPATTEFLTDEGFSEDEQQRQQQQQQQQASSPMYAPPPPAAALEQEEELGFDVQKWSSDYQYLAQAIYMADLDQSGYMPAAEVHHVTSTYNLVYNLSISGPTLDSALTAATDPNYGEVNLEYFIATLQDVHFRENGVY